MYEYEEVRIKMDLIQKNLLEQVAGLHEIPEGAYNIRANGTKLGRNTTANIDIVTKKDKPGMIRTESILSSNRERSMRVYTFRFF